MEYLSDIEIAQALSMRPIREIAAVAGVDEEYLEHYGNYKAKVDYSLLKDRSPARRQADPGDRHQPHPRRARARPPPRVGLADGLRQHGQERRGGPAGALPGPGVRRQGRRGRRRLRPGGAHGGHQPPLHRRLPRHRRGQQPAGRHAGQPHSAGQRPGHRRAADHLEALRGHERPPAAQSWWTAWAAGSTACPGRTASTSPWPARSWRCSAWPTSLDRPEGAAGPDRGGLYLRRRARDRRRPEGRGRHDRPAEGRPQAQPGADAGAHPRLHPRRPLCQHRPRLQLASWPPAWP